MSLFRKKSPQPPDVLDLAGRLDRAAGRLTGWKWTGDGPLDPPSLLREASHMLRADDPVYRYRDKITQTLTFISDKSASGDYGGVIADMATELLGDLGEE